jgi:transcriptional regulator with XRE-family HTH domain
MKGVGERLKELRKRLNMSQEEFGSKLGLKRSSLGKIERGASPPSGKMLQTLASKYNVSMDYLLCNRGTLFYEKDTANPTENKQKNDPELEELLSLMTRLPLARHSVMSCFQRFKIENADIIEKGLAEINKEQKEDGVGGS